MQIVVPLEDFVNALVQKVDNCYNRSEARNFNFTFKNNKFPQLLNAQVHIQN